MKIQKSNMKFKKCYDPKKYKKKPKKTFTKYKNMKINYEKKKIKTKNCEYVINYLNVKNLKSIEKT